MTMHNMDMTKL